MNRTDELLMAAKAGTAGKNVPRQVYSAIKELDKRLERIEKQLAKQSGGKTVPVSSTQSAGGAFSAVKSS
jgi:hypothetical protein